MNTLPLDPLPSVVWFKRDLRVHDHAPLAEAAAQGPVMALYIVEPGLWQQPDAALQHFGFMTESLQDLQHELKSLGIRLLVLEGEAVAVLQALHRQMPFKQLWSHEETGNGFTYARDRAVVAWCREQGVVWHERRQFGVVRRLRHRKHWQPHWEALMAAPTVPAPVPQNTVAWQLAAHDRVDNPATDPAAADSRLKRLSPHQLTPPPGLTHDPPDRQRGGRTQALAVLHDFLQRRCAQYRGGISSPLSAPDACSRLSPYLAWGCVSLREVVQATRAQIASLPPMASRARAGLNAFISRLYWHCHFIQKLESEPAIEWHNMHRGYDDLREQDFNPAHFEALQAGRTGWPMVDACVAMLRETGWLNFRMRAMLVSVAAYPLWLHWRPVGEWLARQFVDYEPGIHWSQLQMQSGTTGINTTRVYNPVKQAQDHDPQGVFVRRWLPAMRRVPDTWLFEPWRMPLSVQQQCGVRVGVDIAQPLVDLAQATREAKARLHARRAEPAVKAAQAGVVERHASRRQLGPGRGSRQQEWRGAPQDSPQLGLDFGD